MAPGHHNSGYIAYSSTIHRKAQKFELDTDLYINMILFYLLGHTMSNGVCVAHRLRWGEEVCYFSFSHLCGAGCDVLNKRDALNLAGWPYLTSQA